VATPSSDPNQRLWPTMMAGVALGVFLAVAGVVVADGQGAAAGPVRSAAVQGSPSNEARVEFALMTWPEVQAALGAGRTTALFYTGGTEQRGPQAVNGGHSLMAEATVREIARRLGNAIAMPVLPYTPNEASARLPGTIGLTPDILAAVLERITEQAIVTGFRNVVLMRDHGGGTEAYATVARKLDAKYAARGIHVWFCDDVYAKAGDDFDRWLGSHGYPISTHAGIPDTSEMLFLGGDAWVRRELLPTALGDPPPDQVRGQGAAGGPAASLKRRNNGISGDARRSTPDLGKILFDMKVDYAVRQIEQLVGRSRR
jgi:creatinine amidohydrolase